MYLFPDYAEMETPGKLKSFLADLYSGKLHREFHYGPDKVHHQRSLPCGCCPIHSVKLSSQLFVYLLILSRLSNCSCDLHEYHFLFIFFCGSCCLLSGHWGWWKAAKHEIMLTQLTWSWGVIMLDSRASYVIVHQSSMRASLIRDFLVVLSRWLLWRLNTVCICTCYPA